MCVCTQHGLSQESVLRQLRTNACGESSSSSDASLLCDLVHDMASVAHGHASTAFSLGRSVAAAAANEKGGSIGACLPRLMLPLLPVSNYLNRLADVDNFDPRLGWDFRDGLLPVRLTWCAWRGRIPLGPRAG